MILKHELPQLYVHREFIDRSSGVHVAYIHDKITSSPFPMEMSNVSMRLVYFNVDVEDRPILTTLVSIPRCTLWTGRLLYSHAVYPSSLFCAYGTATS